MNAVLCDIPASICSHHYSCGICIEPVLWGTGCMDGIWRGRITDSGCGVWNFQKILCEYGEIMRNRTAGMAIGEGEEE